MSSADSEELTLGTVLAFAAAMVVITAAIITTGGILHSFPTLSGPDEDTTANDSADDPDNGSTPTNEGENNATENGTTAGNTSEGKDSPETG